MSALDAICVGNALIDTFMSLQNANEFCRFDKEHNELCITAGAKVMVDEASFLLGGDACNVSVGLTRLGFKSGLVAELGEDDFSEKIKKGLTEEGIDTNYVKYTPNTPSTFSVVINILGDRTIFARHVKRDHDIPLDNLDTKWVYLTSLGLEWKLLYSRVEAIVREKGLKLAFNPGSEQIKEGVESFSEVLKMTDILFVNREEAQIILYGKVIENQEKEDDQTMLFRIKLMGPKTICMTDGERGSSSLNSEGQFFKIGCAPGEVFEKTGAGDAYASGFLAAIMHEKDTKEAMIWGATNSSSVIEHTGSQPGLLKKEQMEERIKLMNV